MRKRLIAQTAPLQVYEWPPVVQFSGYTSEFARFLQATADRQHSRLSDLLSHDWNQSGKFLNQALATVYAYIYGYKDSPCHLRTYPKLEIQLQQAKIMIEEAYLNQWLPIKPLPEFDHVKAGYAYLERYVEANIGVGHALYDYLCNQASPEAIKAFLRLEVCRNEVVDDEVALLVCGLQGNLKRMVSANLWDECGNGDLMRFHTYWLRRLLDHTEDWDNLKCYRQTEKPWFASITSNTFNALLTRPGRAYQAYGCFTTTEAWAAPHFEKLLKGIARTDLSHPDIDLYFRAHCNIDPFHSRELLDGILEQVPPLTIPELREIVLGAHIAVAAGVSQYRLILDYLHHIDTKEVAS